MAIRTRQVALRLAVGLLAAGVASGVLAQETSLDRSVEDTAESFFAPERLDSDEPLPEPEVLRSENEILTEGIAAQVGSGVVLVSEVQRIAAPIEARMRKAGAPPSEIRQMRAEALDRLIETRLIEDVVRRAQLEATDEEVSNAIAAIARDNGLSLEQMQASIASHGLSMEEYRAKIRSELERNKVLGTMVRSRVRIEDDELKRLYEERFSNQRDTGTEVRLRHLLIAVSAGTRDREAACAIASEIRSEIASGRVTFAEIASERSDANAATGGDLGWVHRSELASWMAPAVAGLKPGEMSEVIPMYFGCNLLMLVDRREFQPVTFEQARPKLEEALFRQKMDAEYIAWIGTLREQVYIQKRGVFAEASRIGRLSSSP